MSNLKESFKVDKSEYTKIYSDSDYLLVVPHTHTASCKYGANTKWCTTKRNDDTDFEEHITMGVLVYLIIKNPEIHNKMGSEKFGLYRVNGYELKDLIVYDELNNEHLDGHKYLQNEFEKADRDSDFWKLISSFNEYYQSMSIENITKQKPEKLNESIDLETIKDLCLRRVFNKKATIGNLSKQFMVYYTKGGRIVDIEMVKGTTNVPFKLGDSFNDLEQWANENEFTSRQITRRNRLKEGEGDETKEVKVDPNIYNLCVAILTKRDDEYIDQLVYEHGRDYDSHLNDWYYSGNEGYLVFNFEDIVDWSEYFSGSSDVHYDICPNNKYDCYLDYDYWTDSVHYDVENENYHFINLKNDETIKLCDALISKGFELNTYNKESLDANRWTEDDLAHELRSLTKVHFPSFEEKISDAYQDVSVEAYAVGFRDAQLASINDWETFFTDKLGGIIKEDFVEYHVSVPSLFKYLLRPSSGKSSFEYLVQNDRKINPHIGPSADVFSLSDMRYESSSDEVFETLREKYNTIIDNFIDDTLSDETITELVDEMNREVKILKKYGFTQINNDDTKEIIENRWRKPHETIDRLKQVKNIEGNIFKIPNTDKHVIYYGYSIEHEGHIVYVETEPKKEGNDFYINTFVKRLMDVKDVVSLKTQTQLDLNEIQDIDVISNIKEQSDVNMLPYYALTGDLKNHYGEDNVSLVGDTPKINIYDKHTITLSGGNLLINGKKVVVKTTQSKDINGEEVTYPTIDYITNRIGKQKKLPDNFVDGTKIKASQNFWDTIKKDEGLIGSNGKPALKAYKLGDGRITIGWGHTGALSEPTPKIGETITQSEAQKYLQNDATEAANCVRRILSEWKSKGLQSYMVTQNMFDVMVSLAFNAGCQGLRTSKFIQYVKKQDYKGAASILPNDSTMINGKFTDGLTSRRKREAEIFLK
jgi:lysozyme